MQKESMKGALWVLRKNAKDFAKVDFLDTAGKLQKKDVYDDGDYTVSGVAFIGKTAYVAVTSGGSVSGYFKLDSTGIRAWETDDDGKNNWLYGFETGATDRDAIITSICSFPLDQKTEGLALATYGNGVSVSADSGKTWTTILNRAKLGGDLGTIRMVPSVITSGDGDQSLVSYKVSKDAKITIDVFSYDMRKIRTIVKDAPRSADKSRSTNPKEDFWDGKDKAGRPCTMGVYYVRVKDNHGHIGWGKVMTLGGHK
jgi:flagellar hook assembly protein FlgD